MGVRGGEEGGAGKGWNENCRVPGIERRRRGMGAAAVVTGDQQAVHKSVLERVFAILDSFSAGEPELTLAELAVRTAIPKPTVHRLAAILAEQRLLKRAAHGFRLGIHLFELGELVTEQR